MTSKRFLTRLAITLLIQATGIWIICLIQNTVNSHLPFLLASMTAMAIFCGMMYLGATITARSKQTGRFIQLIMIAVFLKMLVCLALIVGYKKGFDPADDTFIWPFLLIYVTTTIFEVTFLERIGREKQTPSP